VVEHNRFIDCGRADGLGTSAIYRQSTGAAQLRLNYNFVRNTNGYLKVFAASDGGTINAASQKVGNEWFGTAAIGGDSWNPAAPLVGLNGTYTFASPATINANTGATFDLGLSGAEINQIFKGKLNMAFPAGTAAIAGGVGYATNGVRITLFNPGTATLTIPSGTVQLITNQS